MQSVICRYAGGPRVYTRTALDHGVVHDGEVHHHRVVPDDAAAEALVWMDGKACVHIEWLMSVSGRMDRWIDGWMEVRALIEWLGSVRGRWGRR